MIISYSFPYISVGILYGLWVPLAMGDGGRSLSCNQFNSSSMCKCHCGCVSGQGNSSTWPVGQRAWRWRWFMGASPLSDCPPWQLWLLLTSLPTSVCEWLSVVWSSLGSSGLDKTLNKYRPFTLEVLIHNPYVPFGYLESKRKFQDPKYPVGIFYLLKDT